MHFGVEVLSQGGRRGGGGLIRFTLCPLDLNCTYPKYAAPAPESGSHGATADIDGGIDIMSGNGDNQSRRTSTAGDDGVEPIVFAGSSVEQQGGSETIDESSDAPVAPVELGEECRHDAQCGEAVSISQMDGGDEDVDTIGDTAEKEAADHGLLPKEAVVCHGVVYREKQGEKQSEIEEGERSEGAEAAQGQTPAQSDAMATCGDTAEQSSEAQAQADKDQTQEEGGSNSHPKPEGNSSPPTQGLGIKSLFMDLGRLAKADLTTSADTRSASCACAAAMEIALLSAS